MVSIPKFEPGDVAMIRVGTGEWEHGVLREDGSWGCQHTHNGFDERDVTVKRLVVIDPEDAQQVARLRLTYNAQTRDHSVGFNPMQAALREIANPTPRIEEPTATGATVTDSDGEMWVRDARGNWICLHSVPGRDVRAWAELVAQYSPLTIEGVS